MQSSIPVILTRPPPPVLILDSVFGGTTYLGGKFDAFVNIFYVLGVFSGGGGVRFWGMWEAGENPHQEIAGINVATNLQGNQAKERVI